MRKVAPTPSTVLVLGETGCGKEYLAEEIHQLSDRSFQPLYKVNCLWLISSISRSTPSFLAAAKPGKLELADKGTLFIDEISEMNTETQVRLLEFLETLGEMCSKNAATGEKEKADVRIIAASRKDLAPREPQRQAAFARIFSTSSTW